MKNCERRYNSDESHARISISFVTDTNEQLQQLSQQQQSQQNENNGKLEKKDQKELQDLAEKLIQSCAKIAGSYLEQVKHLRVFKSKWYTS